MTDSHPDNTNLALHLYEKTRRDTYAFSYRGPFHADLTSKFVGISENIISTNNDSRKVKRKFSFLLVETFQNVLKHGEVLDSRNHGHFSFSNTDNILVINSINLVKDKEAKELVKMVNEVNSLSTEELKDAWKNKLIEGEIDAKGGAGLGLLEIARKSGQKVKYKLEKAGDQLQKFHQQVLYVNGESKEESEIDYVNKTDELNATMRSENILLEYKGKISQQLILPMMSIIQRSIHADADEYKKIKTVSHILVEMLQNIPEINFLGRNIREGVCLIQKVENQFVLNTGNIIPLSMVKGIKDRLQELQKMSVNELKVMHVRQMSEVISSESKSSSRLGLIEIVRYSEGEMIFSFDPIDDGYVFFTLRVVV